MHVLLGRRGIAKTGAIILTLAFMAAGATAQDERYWKDGPHVGFATGGDVRNEDFAFGYQASYEFNEYASLELSVTRQNDEIQESLDTVPFAPDFNIDMEVYAFALTGRLGFEPVEDVLRLYVGAGIGYYILKTDAQEIRVIASTRGSDEFPQTTLHNLNVEVENALALHVAGGFEIQLSERWELFAEYRHVSLEPDADLEITEQSRRDVFSAPEFSTRVIPDSLAYNHGLVRAGLNYRF